MNLAVRGTSATEAARQLSLPRQMVHYHVLALERAGFLVPHGEVRRRNMVERRLRSSAKTYLIDPDILAALSPGRRRSPDPATPDALLSLTARIQSEIVAAQSMVSASSLPVLSFSSKIQFSGLEQRQRFSDALGDAVGRVIRSFSQSGGSTAVPPDGGPSVLVLALYPLPLPSLPPSEE
ncbi:MAG: hypothetical protein ABI679_06330 [Gemmatimonadota bacterium]